MRFEDCELLRRLREVESEENKAVVKRLLEALLRATKG
jgi:hypothetical protein